MKILVALSLAALLALNGIAVLILVSVRESGQVATEVKRINARLDTVENERKEWLKTLANLKPSTEGAEMGIRSNFKLSVAALGDKLSSRLITLDAYDVARNALEQKRDRDLEELHAGVFRQAIIHYLAGGRAEKIPPVAE